MPREAPYLAVADALCARILAGEWEIGERLPSRARLAEEYGVGRNVMQRAVDGLIIKGLLEGRAGSDTYVRMPRERLRMVRSRHRERRGGSPSRAGATERGRAGAWDSHSQARVPAPGAIAERLAISPGDLCVTTHYEFLADGQPVQLSESWEPWGGIPLGGLLGGVAGSLFGARAALWIGAVGMTTSILPYFLHRWRNAVGATARHG
ncbi:GntR family transcriptional regulator [Streptomyces sp. NPDC098085]|uniref:GntR family transcriptional regulator n=1 Tax=Streptomyces sp. NPDC098085 TaxID=3366094 RepID=UPI00382911BA